MITWLVATAVLMLWALVWCGSKVFADLRGPTPANGVWGLFALAGIVSTLALFVTAALVSVSGI